MVLLLYVKFAYVNKVQIMRRIALLLVLGLLWSCNGGTGKGDSDKQVLSVSIAPFSYFAEQIGGDDFEVNIMVPAGANHHTYEPSMAQLQSLSKSSAFIADGYLDFELSWLSKFRDVNNTMEIVVVANKQDLIFSEASQHGDHMHYEGVDPHFWTSPRSARIIASDLKDLFIRLEPESAQMYQDNYQALITKIDSIENVISEMLSPYSSKSFMIYHPVLAYFARDFGLNQVAVEQDGKEPSPASMKEFVDKARELGVKTIFVQQEFDRKSASVIADEIGGKVVNINPLSADWPNAVMEIARALASGFEEKK